MPKLTPSEVLDALESDIALSASALRGTAKLIDHDLDADLAEVFEVHARSLERILNDLELHYRPGLGLPKQGEIDHA